MNPLYLSAGIHCIKNVLMKFKEFPNLLLYCIPVLNLSIYSQGFQDFVIWLCLIFKILERPNLLLIFNQVKKFLFSRFLNLRLLCIPGLKMSFCLFSGFPNLRLFCIPGYKMSYCLFSRFSNLCRFIFQVLKCLTVCSQDFLTSAVLYSRF